MTGCFWSPRSSSCSAFSNGWINLIMLVGVLLVWFVRGVRRRRRLLVVVVASPESAEKVPAPCGGKFLFLW